QRFDLLRSRAHRTPGHRSGRGVPKESWRQLGSISCRRLLLLCRSRPCSCVVNGTTVCDLSRSFSHSWTNKKPCSHRGKQGLEILWFFDYPLTSGLSNLGS